VGDVMLIPVSDLDLYLQNKSGVRKKKDKAEKLISTQSTSIVLSQPKFQQRI
jgi:predicted translin family RNA/ssDNA-binding protein